MIVGSRRIKDLIRNRASGDSGKMQMLLRHFAMERFLERISVSNYRDDFVIKGGVLVSSLVGLDERATRDIDTTLQHQTLNATNVRHILLEVASINIGDGFVFELGEPQLIMEGTQYGGFRIQAVAQVEKTKTTFKIDVSTGDTITPAAIEHTHKLMFEERTIALRSYNIETVLAEKLETILSLAAQTTRMRDFYDVYVLTTLNQSINYELLASAFEATVTNRHSAASLNESESIIALLRMSNIMKNHWHRFQKANAYASGISWEDALASVRRLISQMKEHGVFTEH